MMNALRKFMYGRYGIDELTIVIFVTSMILVLIGDIFPKLSILGMVSNLLLIIYVYRIFSKNISRRVRELNAYLKFKNNLMYKFDLKKQKGKVIDLKSYKYLKCPSCGQKLRVPRKKGKITVTCSKCKNVFKAKS